MDCSSLLLLLLLKLIGILFQEIPGSLAQDWSVSYTPSRLCALHHSSVVLPCKYTYPSGQVVTSSAWHYRRSNSTTIERRVAHSLADESNCSLLLDSVTQDDAGVYQFSFRTRDSTQDLTNEDGVTLEITDLQVDMEPVSDKVLEGDWVMLICGSCIPSLTVPTYTWYKDGRQYKQKHGDYQLELTNIKVEDEGSYQCSISGHEGLLSSAVKFTVNYPPKNVSVSISSSGEIVEGSSVTLTCSSDANPPVEIYTWFKGKTSVEKGKTYNISNISAEHSGEYKCKCSNEVGHQDSIGVTLNVLYPPKNVSVSINSSGEIVEGSSVTLTCSSDANPPVEKYTWFKGTTSVGKGKTYIISNISTEDSGEYKCKSSNEVGHQDSNSVTLNVLNPPKNVSVSISSSGEIVEGSSVTLTCSSGANPLVENYTWFKGEALIGKGKTYIISKISTEDSGEYKCKCSNEVRHQDSIGVTLNVLYPPKKVSVSISTSVEIVEGSSVTLTCSSDANPPVEIYTWFKEKESSPVGSGKSYRALQSGQYYCEAQNKHGSERSATVSVTLSGGSVIVYVAVGVGLFGIAALLSALCWLRSKRQKNQKEEYECQTAGLSAKDDTYAALDLTDRTSDDVYHTLAIAHPSPAADTPTCSD
ncbi:B-cell receptor CD22 isoform X1 [Pangasianodon hypophthalmus]|uniref:B-cell receptor CD22 isoform X1 n=1 Tax=Pangasianodon hypophthalmus TaxID=310915 RepID=UPI000EFFEFAF|nr:B-cell receptor CD22 isoform X1 [Pangasianodon hypophthalmus]XP_026787898.3 B-cell receptor CD22 isoform X1 [Pangasianodon hypophthalmus]